MFETFLDLDLNYKSIGITIGSKPLGNLLIDFDFYQALVNTSFC